MAERPVGEVAASVMLIDKGNHRHFMAQGDLRAAGGGRPHAAKYLDLATRTCRAADGAAVRFRALERISITPAAPPTMPAWSRITGLSVLPGSWSRSTSPPSFVTALPLDAGDLASSCRSRARPPKYAVSQVIGFIKGKSAIHLARVYGERKRNFVGQHFWARGYFVSTVGRDEAVIREYIQKQE